MLAGSFSRAAHILHGWSLLVALVASVLTGWHLLEKERMQLSDLAKIMAETLAKRAERDMDRIH